VLGYKLYRRPFLKDVGVLTLAVCLVFFVLHDYKIEVWEPWLLIVLYVLFITLTVVGRYVFQWCKRRNIKKNMAPRFKESGKNDEKALLINTNASIQESKNEETGPQEPVGYIKEESMPSDARPEKKR
jgi:Ca2+/Na+ antiporter